MALNVLDMLSRHDCSAPEANAHTLASSTLSGPFSHHGSRHLQGQWPPTGSVVCGLPARSQDGARGSLERSADRVESGPDPLAASRASTPGAALANDTSMQIRFQASKIY